MNRLRIVATLLWLTLASLAWATHFEPKITTNGNEINFVIDKAPELRVVTHVFPPFQRKMNDSITGPFVEIMQLVCKEAHVTCHIRMGAFKDIYQEAIKGRADIIFSFLLEADEERRTQFFLSESIVKTNYCFFVSSTSNWKWTGNPKELEGRTVGVYGPSGTSIVAKRVTDKNPSARLVVDESNLKVFQKLVVGGYGQNASIVANKDVGLDFLKHANIYGPKPAGDIENTTFGFGFSRQSPNIALAPRMLEALKTLKHQGKTREILNNYGLTPAD